MEELEDAVQLSEDARLRLEVTQNALRAEHERALAGKDGEAEEKRKNLVKQVGETEGRLAEWECSFCDENQPTCD